MSLLANSNAIESGGYNIDRSLRFRSSASAYLDRTLTTPTNNKIYTWSGWVKKGIIGTANRKVLFSARNGTNEDYFCYDDTTDNLRFFINSTNASTTSAVYRDASAWYHVVLVVDTTQATAANRVSIYVNGSLAATANGTAPTQNSNTVMNGAYSHRQGAASYNGPWYFDGYLAEVNFIDGQALTPSSFGQTDTITGVWTPKKYTGTYGTNGFYLPFSDNTSATTLAYDKSGNSNNWTANNISTTAGSTYDSMLDVPTLTSATAANYCVLNPINPPNGVTITGANLDFSCINDTTPREAFATFAVSTGKYYFEGLKTNSSSRYYIGIVPSNYKPGDAITYGKLAFDTNTGTNRITMFAVDFDSGKYWTGNQGTWSSGDPALGTGGTSFTVGTTQWVFLVGGYADAGNPSAVGSVNFGQRPFSYTPPTGFVALNTFNLPDPTIKKPNQYMDATLWTGDGSTGRAITNAAGFQPDLVWSKARSSGNPHHQLYDSARGVTKCLFSSLTLDEQTNTDGLTAFNSNGFTVGSNPGVNFNTYTYVGWQWKESATAGFDIVTYTGTGANQNISHSLGVAPAMMFIKSRSATGSWIVWHKTFSSTQYMTLETTGAVATSATVWNSTSPTSSVFSLGASSGTNASSVTYVAYLFAEIAGYSKFGSYTGNGSADGPFVYCGFRPKYVLIKNTSTGTNYWEVRDTSRNTYNAADLRLSPNVSNAESSSSSIDIISNGFKVRATDDGVNGNTYNYIYAAFAETPFKTSLAR